MMKKYIFPITILLCVLFVLGLITYFLKSTPNDKANSEASKNLVVSAEEIYTDLEGNKITFEAFEGKVRVVNSWASWTPFSQTELKDLELLAQEYKNQDIVFLAINRKEPKEIAQQFLSTLQDFKETVFIIDLTDAYYTSVGGFAMPETIVYDAKGAIVIHKRGSTTKEEMKQYIEHAIAK